MIPNISRSLATQEAARAVTRIRAIDWTEILEGVYP